MPARDKEAWHEKPNMTLIGLMPQTWAADLGRGGLASYEGTGHGQRCSIYTADTVESPQPIC
jgi:hypothetical protein